MALPDTFDKLKELLAQDQFEVLLDEENKEEKQEIRLVYLMNDAVESFLVFHEARLTGEYRKEYEGELVSSLSEKEKDEIPGPRYVLVVHQGEPSAHTSASRRASLSLSFPWLRLQSAFPNCSAKRLFSRRTITL